MLLQPTPGSISICCSPIRPIKSFHNSPFCSRLASHFYTSIPKLFYFGTSQVTETFKDSILFYCLNFNRDSDFTGFELGRVRVRRRWRSIRFSALGLRGRLGFLRGSRDLPVSCVHVRWFRKLSSRIKREEGIGVIKGGLSTSV